MIWVKLAFVAMIAVGVLESIMMSSGKAWWIRDGHVRRGGYTNERWMNDRRL